MQCLLNNIMYKLYNKECCKFGHIDKIEVPRPDPETGIVGPSVGKVFVKFEYLVPAKKCRVALSGTYFLTNYIFNLNINESFLNRLLQIKNFRTNLQLESHHCIFLQ